MVNKVAEDAAIRERHGEVLHLCTARSLTLQSGLTSEKA